MEHKETICTVLWKPETGELTPSVFEVETPLSQASFLNPSLTPAQNFEVIQAAAHFYKTTPFLPKLRLHRPLLPAMEAESWSIFHSLLEIREILEDEGLIPLCNGARRDVWLSGAQAQMGGGRVAYLYNRSTTEDEESSPIDILGPTGIQLVGTIDEQKATFYNQNDFDQHNPS